MASSAIIFGDDARLGAVIVRLLRGHGWKVTVADTAEQAFAAEVALVILDAAVPEARDRLDQVRAGLPPASGVPILQHGGARLAGVSAMLPPLDDIDAVAAGIAVFTGALGDHALRRPPFSPFYRLVRLLGMPAAAATFNRFVEALGDALAEAAGCVDPEQAHRLAGLAGANGYPALAHTWRDAERNPDRFADALIATRATLDAIETGDSARYR